MIELILIAIGLCMDTLAVSIATGCAMNPFKTAYMLRFAFILALFQALMPLAGWLAGETVVEYIKNYDHWVAAGLLAFIGGKMFIEGCHFQRDSEECSASATAKSQSLWVVITLAIATSIDALAVGFSYSALGRSIVSLIVACAITTFLFSVGGLLIGHHFGAKHRNFANIVGGIILVAIGIKIVIEHCSTTIV